MTTHELAKKLMELPDLPAITEVTIPGWYGDVEVQKIEIHKIEVMKDGYTSSSLDWVDDTPIVLISATELS